MGISFEIRNQKNKKDLNEPDDSGSGHMVDEGTGMSNDENLGFANERTHLLSNEH